MEITEATVGLDQPGKMLLRLCRHFEHKLNVTYSDTEAHMEFIIGSCDARVNDGALHFICRSKEKNENEELQNVIERHLVRFARKEDVNFNWRVVSEKAE